MSSEAALLVLITGLIMVIAMPSIWRTFNKEK